MKSTYYGIIIAFLVTITACKNAGNQPDGIVPKEVKAQYPEATILEKAGEVLYNTHCKMCHANRSAKDNMLRAAVVSEQYEFEYLRQYITKQDSLVNGGNKEVIAKREEYNSAYLHSFELTDNEVKAILFYLKQ